MPRPTTHVLVCAGAGCVASGSLEISAALRKAVPAKGLADSVMVVETGCLGPCAVGPVVVVYPDGTLYERVTSGDVDEITEEHLLKGRPVERLMRKAARTGPALGELGQIDFFAQQQKIVLRNCGVIDPTKIEEYIARDGYQALAKVLTGMSPEQVVGVVKDSGLRGRGGAGFLTGLKWAFCRKSPNKTKYVLCNADEGDPGAFMDRSILEGDPHSVIEAMAIAAYAIGAQHGYVYVRAEYPLAVKRLEWALGQARERGLLGENILGSGFDFDLEIRMGSGAFVCGEETALMTSIEGNRGEPRPRPPFPSDKGLWGKPSLLNNVETYANISTIILKGPEWYRSIGTEKSTGTKVFALAGAVNNTGLIETAIGTPLGKIIYDIGGGIPGGKAFKAAQMGGPSGGCIPREHLNVPVDYESLTELGAIMGSGGLIVMDEDTCMVDMARFFLDFVQDESCGKCTPCRVGTARMLEIVNRICEGKGEERDIERLEHLGQIIKDTALCGLGQTAPNPVLSTIRHFRDEYIAHIRDRRCPAGVCAALVRAPCQNACPAGVNVPGFVSLVGEKRYPEALQVHRERNPFVSVCARVCFHPCERKCRRTTLDEPVAVRSVKRFMADQEYVAHLPSVRRTEVNAKRNIAIVGAGPAGLSCAYFLARLGYRPTVYEGEDRAGGMLVQAIPAYRLPRRSLEWEIQMIEQLGVEIRCGARLGRDFTLASLRDGGCEAAFVAVGAARGTHLGLKGEDAHGVTDSLHFLRQYNLHGLGEIGKSVAVIGGGNAAIDAARTALRLGAQTVTVLYRRTRAEMPAYEEEIAEAQREGVHLRLLVSPIELITDGGRVTGVKCQTMKLGAFDRSGRRRPEPVAGSDFVVDADQAIVATGQEVVATDINDGVAVQLNGSGLVTVDAPTGRTSVDWVYAGGDVVTGPASVIEAIAAGERAAAAIDQRLTGTSHAFWRENKDPGTAFDPDIEPRETPRSREDLLPVEMRARSFAEIGLAWTEPTALREAGRCLRCDYREPATE